MRASILLLNEDNFDILHHKHLNIYGGPQYSTEKIAQVKSI